jgi:hypothetical protein
MGFVSQGGLERGMLGALRLALPDFGRVIYLHVAQRAGLLGAERLAPALRFSGELFLHVAERAGLFGAERLAPTLRFSGELFLHVAERAGLFGPAGLTPSGPPSGCYIDRSFDARSQSDTRGNSNRVKYPAGVIPLRRGAELGPFSDE